MTKVTKQNIGLDSRNSFSRSSINLINAADRDIAVFTRSVGSGSRTAKNLTEHKVNVATLRQVSFSMSGDNFSSTRHRCDAAYD